MKITEDAYFTGRPGIYEKLWSLRDDKGYIVGTFQTKAEAEAALTSKEH